jgi:hydroxyacylglutathione hydrolase
MPHGITEINLSLPFGLGAVNVYLIKTSKGFILIDTGTTTQRYALGKTLEQSGCIPGKLKLIILTHGDFDHTGNAAYLKQKFGSIIAMGKFDSGMLEYGDMFWNRKKRNAILRILAPILIGFGKSNRIKPDVFMDEKFDLAQYGLQAKTIFIPGHSKGSIGILTKRGDLFCGDLLENTKQVGINSIMDDVEEAKRSIRKLIRMEGKTVYPGHGKPFPFAKVKELPL